MKTAIKELKRSKLYSEELGINLAKNSDEELFKWFLASVLFGTRISETIAKNTYRVFEKYGLVSPERILKAGYDFLVYPVMREGGYVRYDGKESLRIIRNCEMLIAEYGGSLKKLHEEARDEKGLEERLLRFFGFGPVTMNIFLRELRHVWKKSNPKPFPVVLEIAKKYGVNLDKYNRKSITFARIEAGLIRARKASGKL